MRKVVFISAFVFLYGLAYGVTSIEYVMTFENRIHHEAEITINFKYLPRSSVELVACRTSPGRYAQHEFAKNIYGLKAYDAVRHLDVKLAGTDRWIINGGRDEMSVKYTVFGDCLNGTYSSIDRNYILMNMPSVILCPKGFESVPLTIKIKKPEKNWTIATQLSPSGDPEIFTAPDLDYLLDSPVGIAPFSIRKWNVEDGGKSYLFHLYVNHNGRESDVDDLLKMIRPVIKEEIAVFGELPDFENGKYFFISNYLPNALPDGMEHRNSCILTRNNALEGYAKRILTTLVHEFFHSWNVERLVPEGLKPFDRTGVNSSGEMWFAEGATVYYDKLLPVRAGINGIDSFADNMKYHFNMTLNYPALSYFSPEEMGIRASIYDGAVFSETHNAENTYIHYFQLGHLICLGLDLTLRSKFKNTSLDDLMKRMWVKFGRSEKSYDNEDIRIVLGEVTKDRKFADDFFQRYIYGNEQQNFKELLSKAGFLLRKKKQGRGIPGRGGYFIFI